MSDNKLSNHQNNTKSSTNESNNKISPENKLKILKALKKACEVLDEL